MIIMLFCNHHSYSPLHEICYNDGARSTDTGRAVNQYPSPPVPRLLYELIGLHEVLADVIARHVPSSHSHHNVAVAIELVWGLAAMVARRHV